MTALRTLAFAALLALGTPAAASADDHSQDELIESVSKCVVYNSGLLREVKKLVAIPGVHLDQVRHFNSLSTSDCFVNAGNLRVSGNDLIDSFYVALYRKAAPTEAPGEFVASDDVDGEFGKKYRPVAENVVERRALGDCIAGMDVAAAHRFAVAPIWSDDEAADAPALEAAFSACSKIGEGAMAMPQLKGLIAESLYKAMQSAREGRAE